VILSDGNYSFPYVSNKTSNVQWIHIGETDFAYILQEQKSYSAIGIDQRIKTEDFDTIGPHQYTVTTRILTIWIDPNSY
jgi:hypothetical protein